MRYLPYKGTPEAELLQAEYENCPTDYLSTLASKYGYSSVNSFQNGMFNQLGARRPAPHTTKDLYDKPPIIKTDGLLVLADVQVPFQDAEFLNNVLDLAYCWGIKDGVSAGDFLNMSAFSIFIHKPEDKIWKQEREVARDVMRAMYNAVGGWLLLLGNHEVFLIKHMAEQLDMQDILKLLNNPRGFIATNYYYCLAEIAEERWRITHPRNISVIHGRVAGRLANKFHQNVVAFHGHLAGIALTEDGEHIGIDGGVCCEPLALDYASQRDTLRPAMNKGAVILIKGDDNCCHYYHLTPNSDWKALKKLYAQGGIICHTLKKK